MKLVGLTSNSGVNADGNKSVPGQTDLTYLGYVLAYVIGDDGDVLAEFDLTCQNPRNNSRLNSLIGGFTAF